MMLSWRQLLEPVTLHYLQEVAMQTSLEPEMQLTE